MSTFLALATAIVSVLAALSGAALAGRIQARVARDGRSAAERVEAINAVARLAEAIAAHRKAMWLREDLRLRGGDGYAAARAASHETRGAITAPLTVVCIRVPELTATANRAVQATYDLRHAASADVLADLREQALRVAADLVTEAGRLLATTA